MMGKISFPPKNLNLAQRDWVSYMGTGIEDTTDHLDSEATGHFVQMQSQNEDKQKGK